MINGYVNIPSELCNLDQLSETTVIPGIYNKMRSVLELNKQAVGYFTFRRITLVLNPIIYELSEIIHLEVFLGDFEFVITINKLDQVNI